MKLISSFPDQKKGPSAKRQHRVCLPIDREIERDSEIEKDRKKGKKRKNRERENKERKEKTR